jgi:hypothetical protein
LLPRAEAKNSLRLNLARIALLRSEVSKAAALNLEVLGAIRSSPDFYGQLALTQSAMCLSATKVLELAVQLHATADALAADGVPSVEVGED